jgi:hypothetical protein
MRPHDLAHPRLHPHRNDPCARTQQTAGGLTRCGHRRVDCREPGAAHAVLTASHSPVPDLRRGERLRRRRNRQLRCAMLVSRGRGQPRHTRCRARGAARSILHLQAMRRAEAVTRVPAALGKCAMMQTTPLSAAPESAGVQAWLHTYAAIPADFRNRFRPEIPDVDRVVVTRCNAITFVHFNSMPCSISDSRGPRRIRKSTPSLPAFAQRPPRRRCRESWRCCLRKTARSATPSSRRVLRRGRGDSSQISGRRLPVAPQSRSATGPLWASPVPIDHFVSG